MANQSGIDILLNFIVNNKDALKGILTIDASMKNYNKTVNDNSTTVKNNSKVVNDNSTTIINKTTVINKNTDAVKGNSMAFAGLGVAIAGVAASIKSLIQETSNVAIEFETQMRNVNSIAKLSEEQFLKMSDAVRETAKMEGVKDTATGIAKAMYQLVSSGFEGAKALEMAGIASKAASAGLTSTETAVTALAAMMNAYNQKTVPDAINFSNQLFTVVDKGVISFEQLATNLGTVLAQASSAKVSFEEIGAAFITLTKAGINASESETAISNLIRTITDPDKGAVKAAAAAGIEFNAMALESKGLKGVLDDLYKATGGNIEAIAQFIPEARAQKAALTLLKGAGFEYVSALDSMKKANEGAGSTQRALNEQMKAASFDIAKMKALIEDLRIEFGNISKDALMPFLKDIKGIIEFVMSLDKETKTLIVQVGLFAAGVTSLMLGIKALAFVFSPLIGLFGSLGSVGSALVAGLATLRNSFFLLTVFLGTGGGFAVAVSFAVATVLSLKKIVEGVIEAYNLLKDMAGLKMRESALDKERQNARDLIKEYNEARRSKEGLLKMSAEDLKAAGHAFGVRAAETTDPAARKRLREQGIAASSLGKFKEQYEASKKAAAEQAEADAKAAARNKQLNAEIEAANKKANASSKAAAKEKVKHQEDYKNEVNRIMEGLAQDEAKRTLDDLNYKIRIENKKFAEEEAILKKAIKLKQATTAQLKALEKEHQIAITNLYMDAQAEQDKIDKENKDKEKAKQKDADDNRIKAEQEKAQKILELTKEINTQKEQIEGNYFNTIVGFIGKFNSGLAQGIQTFQSYFNGLKAINDQYNANIANIEKTTDVSTEAGKAQADQLSKTAATNAAMAGTVNTIALVGTIALDWLINSINNYEKLTAEADKYNKTLNEANDWILLITKSIPFVGELLAAMGKAIGKAFGASYLEDKLKIQPLLDDISKDEMKRTLTETQFKIEMLNKEYAEKERLLKKAIEDNVASENDLIRLEKLRQAEITKIRLEEGQKQSDNDKKLQEQILDKQQDIIQKAYETEQEAIKKTFRLKKETAEKSLKFYEDEIDKLKSNIRSIDDELAKRQQKRAQSQETATAFQARRALLSSTLPADFARTPIDKFEIESASQEEQLKQSFALGQMSLDQLNKHLMDLAVKKNLFYERISNSLVVGTKEHLDFQKKANDAYGEYASLQQVTTTSQLKADKDNLQSQLDGFKSLKDTELKNIQDIENAQTNALIRLESKWKTPAGAFKLSMDEAVLQVVDKMDAELSNFIGRAKQAIYNFSGQMGKAPTGEESITRNRQLGEATGKKYYTQSELTSYENKIIAEQEKRTQQLAIENAKRQALTQSGGMLGGLGGKSFPGFATGGIFDSNKGFGAAILHDNEMILNPFQQKNLFNLLAAGGGGVNVTINTGPVNSQSDINKIASAVSQVIRTDYLRR